MQETVVWYRESVRVRAEGTLSRSHPTTTMQDDLFDIFDDPLRPQSAGDPDFARPMVSPGRALTILTVHENSFRKVSPQRKLLSLPAKSEVGPETSKSNSKMGLGRLKHLFVPRRLRDFFRFSRRQ